jgi:hypothetical protein
MLSDMRRWVFQALTASWCGGGCSGWMFIAARDRKQKAKSHQDAHTSALIYLLTNVKPIQTIFICSPGGVSVRLWRVKLLVYIYICWCGGRFGVSERQRERLLERYLPARFLHSIYSRSHTGAHMHRVSFGCILTSCCFKSIKSSFYWTDHIHLWHV